MKSRSEQPHCQGPAADLSAARSQTAAVPARRHRRTDAALRSVVVRSTALATLAQGLAAPLQGCAVASVAGAVVGGAVSVGSAVVTTGVKVTGKVVGTAIDAVTPSEAPAAAAPVQQMAKPVGVEMLGAD